MITANQLLIVRRHVQLFRNSTVFRRIHDKCVQKLFEADFQVDAEDDDNYSDESEDEGVEVMSPWTKLMSCTEEMFSEFDSFIERLARLETTISDIKKFFEDTFKKKHLADDLAALEEAGKPKGWATKVEESIIRFFTIQRYADAAKGIQNAIRVLGREEPFEIVENILKATQGEEGFKNQPLSVISNELIKAGETFSAWSGDQIKTLKAFDKSGKIMKWLRENIQDRGDLKTFYELATISAGESDMEVDKVSNFYQSINGYAPLLLDLNIQKCSFQEFLKACQAVFLALERDPLIPDKLIGSNQNLEWIKACKDQQGSVEQTSLTMASKINSTGIYIISIQGPI